MACRSVAGVGIGLRWQLFPALLATERHIDFLELIPENFLEQGGRARRMLDACRERWPLLSHGVALSVGGPDAIPARYLDHLAWLVDYLEAPFFTDHACFAHARGLFFHDLLPLPFSREAADWAAERARFASERVGKPIALENITYYAEMPGAELSEGTFMTRLLEASGARLLLDVNNVFVNAKNHGKDPRDVLFELPLDRVVQIHLAGHQREGELLLDDHGSAVCEEVWELYRIALGEIGPCPTLVEWDTRIPPLDRVLDEADRARTIQEAVLRERATLKTPEAHHELAP